MVEQQPIGRTISLGRLALVVTSGYEAKPNIPTVSNSHVSTVKKQLDDFLLSYLTSGTLTESWGHMQLTNSDVG